MRVFGNKRNRGTVLAAFALSAILGVGGVGAAAYADEVITTDDLAPSITTDVDPSPDSAPVIAIEPEAPEPAPVVGPPVAEAPVAAEPEASAPSIDPSDESGDGPQGPPANPTEEGTTDTSEKVFVCKFVGTPDVDERLQTGQNPISVSINSIKDWDGVIPGYFADAQGRSYTLAYDEGQGEPDVSDCPTSVKPANPTHEKETACFPSGENAGGLIRLYFTNLVALAAGETAANAVSTITDENGVIQTVSVAANDSKYVEFSYPLNSGDHTVTVTTVGVGGVTTVTVKTDCGSVVEVVPPPIQVKELCVGGIVPPGVLQTDSGVLPFDEEVGGTSRVRTYKLENYGIFTMIDTSINGVNSVVVSYAPENHDTRFVESPDASYYVIDSEAGQYVTWVYTYKDEPCGVQITVVPGVTFADECGVSKDAATVPANTDRIAYIINDARVSSGEGVYTVNAVPKDGFFFAEGLVTSWTTTFTNVACATTPIDPTDPTNPTTPATPTDPTNPTTPATPDKPTTPAGNSVTTPKLAFTGLEVLGVGSLAALLLALGWVLFYADKRRSASAVGND